MGSKGSNTSTTQSSANPAAMSEYYSLLGQIGSLPQYQAYTGQLTAPVNEQQMAGIGNINQYANAAQPYMTQAAGLAANAAQPITAANINQYMSPYTQDVVNSTAAQFASQNAQQMAGVKGNAIAQGALGGNREGVAEAETANQQNLAQAPVIAGLENQGYQTGLNTALTEQQAGLSGAYGLANIGQGLQSSALTGANAMVGAGTLEQQTQQANLNAQYQQYLNQMQMPYQMLGSAAGIAGGVGSQMGGTSSTTGPPPNNTASWLGGLTAGVGALGGTGAFGSAGWLAPAMMAALAKGGAVAPKGLVHGEGPLPETHDTLLAQQRQLIHGHRRVQMFPHGTHELRLPHGMSRVESHSGVFHYDPRKVDSTHIHMLSAQGRENELLDLGPVSKDDVMERIRHGEMPLAVVERQPDGTEVRTAAGTHMTAPHQIAAMERTKSPGNSVRVEDPRHVLAKRHERAYGGRIGYDTGGGVANIGQGFAPWIPIQHGAGVPKAPGLPTQPTVAQQMKDIGSLAGAFKGQSAPAGQPTSLQAAMGAQGLNPIGNASNPDMPGGANDILGAAGAGVPVGLGEWRGGSVGRYASGGIANLPMHGRIMMPHGYADGGSPSFDDRFNAAYTPDADVTFTVPSPGLAPSDYIPLPPSRPAGADGTVIVPGQTFPASNGVGNGSGAYPTNRVVDATDFVLPSSVTGGNTDEWRQSADQARGLVDAQNDVPSIITTGPGGAATASALPDDALGYADTAGGHGFGSGTPTPDTSEGGASSYGEGPLAPAGVAPTSGIDWSGNSKLWPALMSAGFGMMASRSPFLGVAIGEGGEKGLQAYQQEQVQAMSQQKIDNEAKRLAQEADRAQKKLALDTETEHSGNWYQQQEIKARVASEADTARYRQSLVDRENSQYLGPTADGTGSVFLDKRTGETRVQPIQIAARPTSGAVESLANHIIADAQRRHEADPNVIVPTLDQATDMARKAPTNEGERLAQNAWSKAISDPSIKQNDPQRTLPYWRHYYGLPDTPGVVGGRQPVSGATPGAAPTAPTGTAAAIPPPAQRIAGQTYQTPKGPFIWTGTGWQRPPQ